MNKKILILDDEPWQVSWIQSLARSAGWEAVFSDKFDKASALYDEIQPGIVVVDMRIGDEAPIAKGVTLANADQSWIGLRFVRLLRVEKKSKSAIFVYTGIDRDDLKRIIEDSFSAKYFSKFESGFFEENLEAEMKRQNK